MVLADLWFRAALSKLIPPQPVPHHQEKQMSGIPRRPGQGVRRRPTTATTQGAIQSGELARLVGIRATTLQRGIDAESARTDSATQAAWRGYAGSIRAISAPIPMPGR